MVRDFQSVIGREAREQMLEQCGRLPDAIVACVGGGSNAMGIFHAFRDDDGVDLIGVGRAVKGSIVAVMPRDLPTRTWPESACCTARILARKNN